MSLILSPERQAVLRVAELMCIAARTAPKGCGNDNLVTAIVTEEADRELLAAAMEGFAVRFEAPFFARDAANLRAAATCVLIDPQRRPAHLAAARRLPATGERLAGGRPRVSRRAGHEGPRAPRALAGSRLLARPDGERQRRRGDPTRRPAEGLLA